VNAFSRRPDAGMKDLVPPRLFFRACSLLLGVFLLLLPAGLSAQTGFEEIFSDPAGTDEGAPLSEGAGPASGGSSLPVLTGEIGPVLRWFPLLGEDTRMDALVQGELTLTSSAGPVEAHLTGEGEYGQAGEEAIRDARLKTALIRWFFRAGYLEAGWMTAEWGKGDGLHVLDPLNPPDQTRGISEDLNEMKKPELMLRLFFHYGRSGLLELTYLPLFHPAVSYSGDIWDLSDPTLLPNPTFAETGTPLRPQGGIRYTWIAGPADLGFCWYGGYMTSPGYRFNQVFQGGDPLDPANYITYTSEVFTPAHLFGTEGVLAAGIFTFRWEAGWWLTRDIRGDEPEYYNNQLVFLAGADMTVPGTGLFLELQASEKIILDFDALSAEDMDLRASWNGKCTATTVTASADLPLFRDRLKLRFSGIWLAESGGYMAYPQIFWYPRDGLEVNLEGQYFGSFGTADSWFKTWEDNSFVRLALVYRF